jgi:uncharacterized OB-fold protein
MSETQERPTTRQIPAPAQNLESKVFWLAAREGTFLIKKCNACGEVHWYPRNLCPFCFSSDTVWQESPGEGVIYTYSLMHRNTPVPYAIAYVNLDEGPAVMTNIIDYTPETLKIGQRVKVKWTPTNGDNPPVFTFAPI